MDDLHDVVIVGGGPAGSAAALQLAQNGLAERTLLLDAARFPREKLCGGGLVRDAERLLAHLDVGELAVPSVVVQRLRVEYHGGRHVAPGRNLFRVVRREDFDHALIERARKLGVDVREGEPVVDLRREGEVVRIETPDHAYRARVVIGADGSHSRVRRVLVGAALGRRMVALEVLTPDVPADEPPEAVFDFRPVAEGLRGYAWDFPSSRAGELLMNRGIGGLSWPRGVSLRTLFATSLERRGLDIDRLSVSGWWAPAYDPASPQGGRGVLLAGDAVGVDPWLGEGITTAIGSGMLAAHAATEGLSTENLDFGDHHERLRDSAVGWQLARNASIADPFYEAAAKPGGLEELLAGVAR